MQRLFSMFPGGAAGCGLMLLRVCAAGMLLRNSVVDVVSVPTWETGGVILLVAAFCLGAFTPVSCVLSAMMQVFLVLHAHESDPYHIVFTFCVTCVVFFLGPGAFSLDSRLFGRRLIVRSDSK